MTRVVTTNWQVILHTRGHFLSTHMGKTLGDKGSYNKLASYPSYPGHFLLTHMGKTLGDKGSYNKLASYPSYPGHFLLTHMGKTLGDKGSYQNYHFFWQLQHSCTLTAGYHHRTVLSTGLLHMVNWRRIHCNKTSGQCTRVRPHLHTCSRTW